MDNTAKVLQLAPQAIQQTSVKQPVKPASFYLSQIRQKLGRSAAAYNYDNLSEQQKAIVLYGAKLAPSIYLHTQFDLFTNEQREQVRKSLIAIRDLASAFGGMDLGRASVMPVKAKPQQVHPAPIEKSMDFDELTKFAAEIACSISH